MFAAVGLLRGLRWAFWLAVAMLAVNLFANIINVIAGTEPKAIVGIPVVLLVLAYLMRKRTKHYFR
jgi:uncharacterized membrane protein (DUF2068 family)